MKEVLLPLILKQLRRTIKNIRTTLHQHIRRPDEMDLLTESHNLLRLNYGAIFKKCKRT